MRATATSTEATPHASHYRAHLDGLRTVAVYLVVAFHAGVGAFAGGYLGVDIFFVLSGYLVTGILLRDVAATGRIRGQRFYSRRVRRILPAAAVTLVVTAVAYTIIATPAEARDALGAFRAAFLYVANWFFVRQSTDYFAAHVESNPVLQFWSLAVEEQFYLLWPLLLTGLVALATRFASGARARMRWWTVRSIVVAAGLASATLALHLARTNLPRAYYGTDTRAYQLLAGAAVALTPQVLHLERFGPAWRRAARVAGVGALVVLVALATSIVDLGPVTRGIVATAAAVLLIVALENSRGGVARGLLASAPFVFLGQISYGVYLWHWPVIVVATHGRSLDATTVFLIACVGATALAFVSFRLLERPIRAAGALDRLRVPVIATGLLASLVLGVFVMPVILDRGSSTVDTGTAAGSSSGPKLLDWRKAEDDFPERPDCLGQPVARCTVVHGNGKRVVLMGDSDAWMWMPALIEIAKERDWQLTVLVYPTCPWQRDLQVLQPQRFPCADRQADWYGRVIPEIDPDVIVLVHQAFDDPERGLPFVASGGRGAYPNTPKLEPLLRDTSTDALGQLERSGRTIVILEPIPDPPADFDPISCLSTGAPVAECSYRGETQITPLVQFYRDQAAASGGSVATVDLGRVVCPAFPTCDAVVRDVIVKRDRNHLTETFSRAQAAALAKLLDAAAPALRGGGPGPARG